MVTVNALINATLRVGAFPAVGVSRSAWITSVDTIEEQLRDIDG